MLSGYLLLFIHNPMSNHTCRFRHSLPDCRCWQSIYIENPAQKIIPEPWLV